MAKRNDSFASDQPDLFQQVSDAEPVLHSGNAPDLDIGLELLAACKGALRQAKQHGLSRERVVERMNQCLPEDEAVTLRQLNAWCAQSKEFSHFPARYLPAFVWAVGGALSPLDVIAGVLGLGLVDEHDRLATELGRVLSLEGELKDRKRFLQQQLRR